MAIRNIGTYAVIPLPHLGYGIDVNGDPVELTVSEGVTAGYSENGSLHLQDYGGVLKEDGSIVPNNFEGQPLADGTYIAGGKTRLNTLPSKVRLFTAGDTEAAKIVFDKSNTTYWKAAIQDLVNYDSSDTGLWDISELTQDFIYEYATDAFKYQLWIKVKNNVLKDLFLYPANLEGDNICRAKKYVDSYETYASVEDATLICKNDIII